MWRGYRVYFKSLTVIMLQYTKNPLGGEVSTHMYHISFGDLTQFHPHSHYQNKHFWILLPSFKLLYFTLQSNICLIWCKDIKFDNLFKLYRLLHPHLKLLSKLQVDIIHLRDGDIVILALLLVQQLVPDGERKIRWDDNKLMTFLFLNKFVPYTQKNDIYFN